MDAETIAVSESLTATSSAASIEDGREQKATSMAVEQVLESRKWLLSRDHPDKVCAMANATVAWSKMCRLADAGGLVLEVLEYRKRPIGKRHPSGWL